MDPSIENESPFLVANNLGHPVLRNDTLGDGTFVPNDVSIGGSNKARFILLTGPNMGGKSTLLRQVCLAVILAQVSYCGHFRFFNSCLFNDDLCFR